MDTKSKNYSHSLLVKIVVFIIIIGCFTEIINKTINIFQNQNSYVETVIEDSYYDSHKFNQDMGDIITILTNIAVEYKNEGYIKKGGTITADKIKSKQGELYDQYSRTKMNSYNTSYEEDYENFKTAYADKIAEISEDIIQQDLKQYNIDLERLNSYKGVEYYISDSKEEFTNSSNTSKEYFKSQYSYIIYDKGMEMVFPEEVNSLKHNNSVLENNDRLVGQSNTVMYIGFTDDYINSEISDWKENKNSIINSVYIMGGLLICLGISFIYLVVIIGRKSFDDKEVHLNLIDKIYTEINMIMCLILISIWFVMMSGIIDQNLDIMVIPITAIIATVGLILVLSLVKHLKNGTFIKHTILYCVLNRIFNVIRDIYNSGNIGAKVIFIIVGYSAILGVTIFMFPITIGVAIWLAIKKIKEFNLIKEGVKRVKDGDLNYKIELNSKDEFGNLASDINSITDGLSRAVENELKSQRLKTDLITNVSHDIRTPLTSIITYVDLLKNEEDREKAKEYIEIIEEKAQRLKTLTDDLFEASKASSKDIPVNLEKIDIVSLMTQGFGELDDKIQEQELDFKINSPSNKVYITADGKLFWRVIENLLSNIFKYSQKGSRVYIDIEELENTVMIKVKNISAYELNISAEELMERFKRGDESRSTQGSGLGLSIARSLVENQNGKFNIEIDGDLFKAIIEMPKYNL